MRLRHKYANKSLNASLEAWRAFSLSQGLGVLHLSQARGGSPDVTLARRPIVEPMRRAPWHNRHAGHVLCALGFNSMHTNQKSLPLMDDVGVRRLASQASLLSSHPCARRWI